MPIVVIVVITVVVVGYLIYKLVQYVKEKSQHSG